MKFYTPIPGPTSYPPPILFGYLAYTIVSWDVEMMGANPRQDSSMEK